jgi:hypothetical protein
MGKKMAALLALGAACFCAPASAGLYRCGNVFQDRPCDAGVDQQVLRGGKGGKASAIAPQAPKARPAAAPPVAAPTEAVRTIAAPAPSRAGTAPSAACGNLREQRTALDSRLRIGGSPATTDMLQRQRREVDQNMGEAGC